MTDVNHTVTGSEGSTNAGGSSAPGSQTDPALLLKSLQEERDKRREAEDAKKQAEDKLQELQDALASGDTSSAEAKVQQEKITKLEGEIARINSDTILADLQVTYPAIKEKLTEFKEFMNQYPGVDIGKVAKIYLSENGLLDTSTPRKGLEKPAGGGRTNQPTGMTYSQAEDLRKNNFRKYTQLLREGKLNDLQEG